MTNFPSKQSKISLSIFFFLLLITQFSFAQDSFTFTGNGKYSDCSQWKNNKCPDEFTCKQQPGIEEGPAGPGGQATTSIIFIEGNCEADYPKAIKNLCSIKVKSGGTLKISQFYASVDIEVEPGGTLDINTVQMNSHLNIKGTLKAKQFKMNLTNGGKVEVGF